MCVCVFVSVHFCVSVSTSVSLCVYVCPRACVRLHLCLCLCISMSVSIFTCKKMDNMIKSKHLAAQPLAARSFVSHELREPHTFYIHPMYIPYASHI